MGKQATSRARKYLAPGPIVHQDQMHELMDKCQEYLDTQGYKHFKLTQIGIRSAEALRGSCRVERSCRTVMQNGLPVTVCTETVVCD